MIKMESNQINQLIGNGHTLKNYAMCKTLKQVEQELNETLCNSGFDNRRVLWALVTYDIEIRKFKIYDWRDETYNYSFRNLPISDNEIPMLNRFEINSIVKDMIELAPNQEQKLRQLHIKAQLNSFDIGRFIGEILIKQGHNLMNYEGWTMEELGRELKSYFGASKEQTDQFEKYLRHESLLIKPYNSDRLEKYGDN